MFPLHPLKYEMVLTRRVCPLWDVLMFLRCSKYVWCHSVRPGRGDNFVWTAKKIAGASSWRFHSPVFFKQMSTMKQDIQSGFYSTGGPARLFPCCASTIETFSQNFGMKGMSQFHREKPQDRYGAHFLFLLSTEGQLAYLQFFISQGSPSSPYLRK